VHTVFALLAHLLPASVPESRDVSGSGRFDKPSVGGGSAVEKKLSQQDDAHTAFQTAQQAHPGVLVNAEELAPDKVASYL
jgi:hypothetical protein